MNTEAEQTPPKPAAVTPKTPLQISREDTWKVITICVSIAACICSVGSCIYAGRSSNAAVKSANAALTNAEWVTYQRNPHHDVIARVLRANFVLRGYSPEDTNGLAYVDLALINNGNQSEIIRYVTFYYNDGSGGTINDPRIINLQLPKGDKQVLHLVLTRRFVFTGKDVEVDVGVTAIGPDAEDIESKWSVTKFSLAPDGNGGSMSRPPANAVKVISNERLPHQRHEEVPFM